MNLTVLFALAAFCIPFLGFLFLGLTAKKSKTSAPLIGTILLFLSLIASILVLFRVVHMQSTDIITFKWIESGPFLLDFGLRIDGLCAIMLTVVTLVSFLVHLFSMDYMKEDPGIGRYYTELQLFTASMIGVVLSINLLQLFAFWELVGLCSYLLIGFWFQKRSAYQAAKKAFFVTKIGDIGFFLGILMIFFYSNPHTLNLVSLGESWTLSTLPVFIATGAGLLVFCGAVGKSAQFPLHIWLPNAMEGPTPVSALIHAATMVAAGVYMVARCLFLFTPSALMVVMFIGGFTTFFAATVAIVQSDIKKVLAYSTISQLGYMILALGSAKSGPEAIVSAGAVAGLFHLITHAMFKGLLFLGSGSVIHATHTQDMREMGGLIKKMPITGITFILGSLALAGIFPFAGFWSKDAILVSVLSTTNHYSIAWIPFIFAITAAFMTPFYMTRCVWLTFFGKPRKENHAHEASWRTTFPLLILALLSIGIGLFGAGFFHEPLQHLLMGKFFESEGVNWGIISGSTFLALLGIFLGFLLYAYPKTNRNKLINVFKPIINFLKNKWYIDEAWTIIAIKPMFRFADIAIWIDQHFIDRIVNGFATLTSLIANGMIWFDKNIVDGLVNGTGTIFIRISCLAKQFDEKVIDTIVNGSATAVGYAGDKFRKLQTGYLPNYTAIMFLSLGMILLIVALAVRF
jgi:NADH-quinone oxidoreductase subunit L